MDVFACYNELRRVYNNVYKTPYYGTKPGVIRKISFQATNSKIYLTILNNRYGSTGPKRSFWVLKRVKMPYIGIQPGIIAKVLFQATNRKIYLTLLCNRYKEDI